MATAAVGVLILSTCRQSTVETGAGRKKLEGTVGVKATAITVDRDAVESVLENVDLKIGMVTVAVV